MFLTKIFVFGQVFVNLMGKATHVGMLKLFFFCWCYNNSWGSFSFCFCKEQECSRDLLNRIIRDGAIQSNIEIKQQTESSKFYRRVRKDVGMPICACSGGGEDLPSCDETWSHLAKSWSAFVGSILPVTFAMRWILKGIEQIMLASSLKSLANCFVEKGILAGWSLGCNVVHVTRCPNLCVNDFQ